MSGILFRNDRFSTQTASSSGSFDEVSSSLRYFANIMLQVIIRPYVDLKIKIPHDKNIIVCVPPLAQS